LTVPLVTYPVLVGINYLFVIIVSRAIIFSGTGTVVVVVAAIVFLRTLAVIVTVARIIIFKTLAIVVVVVAGIIISTTLAIVVVVVTGIITFITFAGIIFVYEFGASIALFLIRLIGTWLSLLRFFLIFLNLIISCFMSFSFVLVIVDHDLPVLGVLLKFVYGGVRWRLALAVFIRPLLIMNVSVRLVRLLGH
jgi:hypothetical protein